MSIRVAALVAGLLAAAAFTWGTTSPGPGLDPDAESYLGAAQSFVRAGTFRIPTSSWSAMDSTEPLTHFPPGMPILVAGPVAAGFEPVAAGRIVVLFSAVLTWGVLVLLMGSATSLRVAVATAVIALVTPALVTVHLSVLSEPPFLAAMLGVLWTMWAYARSPTPGSSLGAGLAAAAAVLLRYAGMSLVLTAGAWIWMAPAARTLSFGARVRRLALVMVPTACTLGPWLLHSVRVAGAHSVREIATYGGLASAMGAIVITLGSWIIPGVNTWWAGCAAVVVMGAILGMGLSACARVRRTADALGDDVPAMSDWRRAVMLGRITALTLVVYVGFLLASRLFADPDIPFDERILAPALLLGETLTMLTIAIWWRGRRRAARALVACGVGVWFVGAAAISTRRAMFAREDGNDFANVDWRDSPTLAWVRSPAGGQHRVLYTNWPAAMYFQAGRAAHELPGETSALTLRRFRDRLARTHGVLVGFTTRSPDWASPDTLAALLRLRQIAKFEDGGVWEVTTGMTGTTGKP